MSEGASLPLSLVICTYNRPDLVAQVLETVAQQDAPSEAYDALVIDNASPRDMAAAVKPLEDRVPGLRCIREEEVGLSHARNRGWREARGDYVAYVDDDCKLPPEWISTALGIIRDVKPVMFGGPYRAFYMTPKPRWFRDEYGSAGCGASARALVRESLSGGNMVIRKDALEGVGGFDPSLGMTGMTVAYGEETALQGLLRERYGPECVYYDPALFVYHLVRPEKMSVWWIMRRRFMGGLYGYRCGGSNDPTTEQAVRLYFVASRMTLGFVLDVAKHLVTRDRSQYPTMPNYIWEHASYRLERLGQLWGRILPQRTPKAGAV